MLKRRELSLTPVLGKDLSQVVGDRYPDCIYVLDSE